MGTTDVCVRPLNQSGDPGLDHSSHSLFTKHLTRLLTTSPGYTSIFYDYCPNYSQHYLKPHILSGVYVSGLQKNLFAV